MFQEEKLVNIEDKLLGKASIWELFIYFLIRFSWRAVVYLLSFLSWYDFVYFYLRKTHSSSYRMQVLAYKHKSILNAGSLCFIVFCTYV